MPALNPRQLIGALVLISVATSALVTLIAFGLLVGEPPNRVVERVIERAPGGPSDREISERVLRQDELVVAAVKRASPSVVSIVASKDVPVVERFFVDPFQDDPSLERFFGGDQFRVPQFRQKGTEKRDIGSGTGFVVSADGLILTNRHVVADTAAEYTVFLNDGTKLAAKVLARDPVQDLAVVKVDPPGGGGLPVLPLGNSDDVAVGQSVIAIGNALGKFSNTVSVGVISGLQRTIVASGPTTGPEALAELIQTDAAINPGNSGGPILNLKGEVVAISTAMAEGAENIGFAIPISKARRAIESVKASGRIIYPFLGIRYVMVTKAIAAQEKLPVDYGAYIIGGERDPAVIKSSPADTAGVKAGDVIIEFDGQRLEAPNTLSALIQKRTVGERVTLKVRRGAETLTLTATLEERR